MSVPAQEASRPTNCVTTWRHFSSRRMSKGIKAHNAAPPSFNQNFQRYKISPPLLSHSPCCRSNAQAFTQLRNGHSCIVFWHSNEMRKTLSKVIWYWKTGNYIYPLLIVSLFSLLNHGNVQLIITLIITLHTLKWIFLHGITRTIRMFDLVHCWGGNVNAKKVKEQVRLSWRARKRQRSEFSLFLGEK